MPLASESKSLGLRLARVSIIIRTVSLDYFGIADTKMNWNSANFAGLLPITLRFSQKQWVQSFARVGKGIAFPRGFFRDKESNSHDSRVD
jgi:hypothetical protein